MYTIISGSNRKSNRTLPFAQFAHAHLNQNGQSAHLLDLCSLSGSLVYDTMYSKEDQPDMISQIQQDIFIPTDKFWFFVPEYNGSYPGVIKVLLDTMSTVDIQKTFQHKKAMLTGVASGRAGNLRGMDHLAEVLNHLGVHVHPNKKPISSIYQFLDEQNQLTHDKMKEELMVQAEAFCEF